MINARGYVRNVHVKIDAIYTSPNARLDMYQNFVAP
jgi:hypothetical protein